MIGVFTIRLGQLILDLDRDRKRDLEKMKEIE
jgi:hypothetical protein